MKGTDKPALASPVETAAPPLSAPQSKETYNEDQSTALSSFNTMAQGFSGNLQSLMEGFRGI